MVIYKDKGRLQGILQNFYCNYPKNSLSWNSVYPYSRMVSYDLLLSMLKIETSTGGTNSMPFLVFRRDHLRSTSGIICGSGSFAVQFGDHFRPGDHLRRCTVPYEGGWRCIKLCLTNPFNFFLFPH